MNTQRNKKAFHIYLSHFFIKISVVILIYNNINIYIYIFCVLAFVPGYTDITGSLRTIIFPLLPILDPFAHHRELYQLKAISSSPPVMVPQSCTSGSRNYFPDPLGSRQLSNRRNFRLPNKKEIK